MMKWPHLMLDTFKKASNKDENSMTSISRRDLFKGVIGLLAGLAVGKTALAAPVKPSPATAPRANSTDLANCVTANGYLIWQPSFSFNADTGTLKLEPDAHVADMIFHGVRTIIMNRGSVMERCWFGALSGGHPYGAILIKQANIQHKGIMRHNYLCSRYRLNSTKSRSRKV